MTYQNLIDNLPSHLRLFVKEQDYAQYSPKDHTAWRFLMRMLTRQLSQSAHPVYLEGMEKTGITLDRIPTIEGMNEKLSQLGWAAVVVDGFIPPAIFMEFQARRILPIAQDMRSAEHLLYTPAPDIVHEAAGHAPFIVDDDYAEYLQSFGEIGMKALATKADYEVYEAIRHLSIVKESPSATSADIKDAEQRLEKSLAEKGEPSEAALLSRLHWWTVEYGLVGKPEQYHLFGAGLLSSLGESASCLDDQRVRKVPLTVDCINTDYDITSQQPQLFVTSSCRHLSQVLDQFSQGMAFRQGGSAALRKAIASESVATAEYSSGLQVSGRVHNILTDAMDNPIYLSTQGPTQLSHRGSEIEGQGLEEHPEGFGSPIGKVQNLTHCLSDYTVDELAEKGIKRGRAVRLNFVSGITVSGVLEHIERRNHRNVLFSFSHCTVNNAQGEVLFEPSWGRYDMAIGERIASVSGGAADRERYPLYSKPSTESTPNGTQKDEDVALMTIYDQLNIWSDSPADDDLSRLYGQLKAFPKEWLARCELLCLLGSQHHLTAALVAELEPFKSDDGQPGVIVSRVLDEFGNGQISKKVS
ncbi:aromatic amino acid hydroxylase [Litorivivens sp.]|uniref:aromatic amino acid hydroxylase n=1 Tax=Litorivivens sp. TaxID=2020868 RepID=UPI003565038D